MLLHLKIKNIAVIEEADIDFKDGLNVLTGETGAGKSILIDSISMLTGVRSNRELIRTGETMAFVGGLFMPDDKVFKILQSCGIDKPEDGLLQINREINISGKSVCRINGEQCPLSVLKSIGYLLINIHGQQDAFQLYAPEKHIILLDKWCADELSDKLKSYRESYKAYISAAKKRKALKEMAEKRNSEIDFLEYEINEIEAAALMPGEEQALSEKRTALINREKIAQAKAQAVSMLFDDAGCARENMDIAAAKLEYASGFDKALEKTAASLKEALYILDDINRSGVLKEENYVFGELEEITDRLDVIKKLERKYGATEADILNRLEASQNRLKELKENALLENELDENLIVLKRDIEKKAEELHNIRLKNAEKLSAEIEKQLEELNMQGSKFVVDIKKVPYGGLGCDGVEFFISPNRGEDVKPLSKIASGGELSRIMLAIKCIMARTDDAETYVFDEIDSGVSGRAAEKVAAKLQMVSEKKQTLVITHLGHIAAAGKHHYKIEKLTEGSRTKTYITPLDESGRIREIARINSGSDLTAAALNQAKELLEKAKKHG